RLTRSRSSRWKVTPSRSGWLPKATETSRRLIRATGSPPARARALGLARRLAPLAALRDEARIPHVARERPASARGGDQGARPRADQIAAPHPIEGLSRLVVVSRVPIEQQRL